MNNDPYEYDQFPGVLKNKFDETNKDSLDEKIFKEKNIYTREALVMASLREKPECKYLEKILKDSLERGQQLEKESKKNSLQEKFRQKMKKNNEIER